MSTVAGHRIRTLTPEMAGMRMSPEEFDAVEDWAEDYYFELVQGVLAVSPPPSECERGPNEMLGHWLLHYREHHPLGSALDYTLPENLIKTPISRRRADRVVWTGLGRLPVVKRDWPTIAVEFVSEGKRNARRDYVQKRDEYLRTELLEYWIIDRFRRQMTVYRREGDELAETVIEEHQQYTTPLLPGFQLPLSKLLEIADALGDSDN
jgi:Uma2 family endonuclease